MKTIICHSSQTLECLCNTADPLIFLLPWFLTMWANLRIEPLNKSNWGVAKRGYTQILLFLSNRFQRNKVHTFSISPKKFKVVNGSSSGRKPSWEKSFINASKLGRSLGDTCKWKNVNKHTINSFVNHKVWTVGAFDDPDVVSFFLCHSIYLELFFFSF